MSTAKQQTPSLTNACVETELFTQLDYGQSWIVKDVWKSFLKYLKPGSYLSSSELSIMLNNTVSDTCDLQSDAEVFQNTRSTVKIGWQQSLSIFLSSLACHRSDSYHAALHGSKNFDC